MGKTVFAETLVIEPVTDVKVFKAKVKDQYFGSRGNDKIASDIIEIVEMLEKGSYTINERRGEPVLNQLFPIESCDEYERYMSGYGHGDLPPNFYVSLEAFETHCSDYHGDTAYVPVVVFHACSINNELLTVINREMYPNEMRAVPNTIRPSTIKGRVAIAFSVGGY